MGDEDWRCRGHIRTWLNDSGVADDLDDDEAESAALTDWARVGGWYVEGSEVVDL